MLRLSKYERGALQKLVPQNHARRMHHSTPGHVPRDIPVKEKTNGAVEVRNGNLPDLRVERVPTVLRRIQLVGEEDDSGHGPHARPTPSCVPSPPPEFQGLRCRSDPGPTPLPRGRAGISACGLPVTPISIPKPSARETNSSGRLARARSWSRAAVRTLLDVEAVCLVPAPTAISSTLRMCSNRLLESWPTSRLISSIVDSTTVTSS